MTENDTPTMRAIRQETLGGTEVLREVELPRPAPGFGEILVEVHAAGLNPTDWKNRESGITVGRPPFVLGWDVSGVVAGVGIGVTLFRPGDEVFGMLPYPRGVGAHAEYVTAPTRCFAAKPAVLDHVQAGALPLAALTAWQALVDTAGLGPGQRVLIHAAAGGVGHLAVQVAKARGAHVVGTASAPKHDFLRRLGADEVIDYHATDFVEELSGLDVVLDTLGGENAFRSLDVLRPGGIVVSIIPSGGTALGRRAAERGVRAAEMLVEADHAGMAQVAGLAAAGRLRATIAGTFPLARAAEAHARGETGRTTGKLVLVVRRS
ncbi:NADP-dependent oxidoreductase [Streptomyces hainanensis]|nr:NADP-dependent oxidoreductase [Streptomyces hainanensis]